MARLLHHTRHVLPRVYCVTGGLAASERGRCGLHAGIKLTLAVEGRNDHVTPLVPVRVIAIMTHDEAANAVIVRINLGHYSSIRTASPSPAPGHIGTTGGQMSAFYSMYPISGSSCDRKFRIAFSWSTMAEGRRSDDAEENP